MGLTTANSVVVAVQLIVRELALS